MHIEILLNNENEKYKQHRKIKNKSDDNSSFELLNNNWLLEGIFSVVMGDSEWFWRKWQRKLFGGSIRKTNLLK